LETYTGNVQTNVVSHTGPLHDTFEGHPIKEAFLFSVKEHKKVAELVPFMGLLLSE
jgi:hypothetical protein